MVDTAAGHDGTSGVSFISYSGASTGTRCRREFGALPVGPCRRAGVPGGEPGARRTSHPSRRADGHRVDLGPSLNALGYLALDQGDYAVARTAFEERLAIQREAGIVRNIALSVSSLGSLALARGLRHGSQSVRGEPGHLGRVW